MPDPSLWHWRHMLTSILLTMTLLIPTSATAHDHRTVHPSRSSSAHDMTGLRPSLYTGKWYKPSDEDRRRCIVLRESHANYRAANRSSSARGAYQFLDRQWRHSLVWMMLDDEHKGSPLRPILRALRDREISQWNRYWQDRAFWTVWRHGKGAHHWRYPPKPC